MTFTDRLMMQAAMMGIPFHSITLDLRCEMAADEDMLDATTTELTRALVAEGNMWRRKAIDEDERRWLEHGIPSIDARVHVIEGVDAADLAWGSL